MINNTEPKMHSQNSYCRKHNVKIYFPETCNVTQQINVYIDNQIRYKVLVHTSQTMQTFYNTKTN